MHELQETRLRSRRAQLLDESQRDAAAPVHRQSGGLVDREEPLVLENDGRLERSRDLATAARFSRRREPQRRKAQHVARRDAHVGTDTSFVEPDLAAAQDPVNVTFWNALKVSQQEIVDTLPGLLVVDGNERCDNLA